MDANQYSDDAFTLADRLLAELPYSPSGQQVMAGAALARFCMSVDENTSPVFILNGYAGTGKTSLVGALTRVLPSIGYSSVLLAPTGRAAKVLSANAGRGASTIHRRIYRHSLHGEVPGMRENRSRDTVFIVDEASMIPGPDASGNDLLSDLIHYVFTGQNCRLLLMGDTAQLPPVGSDVSPAMDPKVLKSFGLRVSRVTLTAIARQKAGSGILINATLIRKALAANSATQPEFLIKGFNDVKMVEPAEVPEELAAAYDRYGTESAVVICRSNRDATAYNAAIRDQVFFYEEELVPGELLIVAKNNYQWTKNVKGMEFIANGDVLMVERVIGTEERFGYRFADVELSVPDTVKAAEGADSQPQAVPKTFVAKVMIDTLYGDAAAMPAADLHRLFQNIEQEFVNEEKTDVSGYNEAVKQYGDALQVKYAYAVTCHKAQGGQWPVVFVDCGYLPEGADAAQYFRWLYTAVTRPTKMLCIIGSVLD